jgi:hypothetical protein
VLRQPSCTFLVRATRAVAVVLVVACGSEGTASSIGTGEDDGATSSSVTSSTSPDESEDASEGSNDGADTSTGGEPPPDTITCDAPPEFMPEAQPAIVALKKAATFFREEVATHEGYVWRTTEDLAQRWGEGDATPDQIWVQPPGTPAVAMAYLRAYHATCDAYYLEAAHASATALLYGQLRSGGWEKAIDFDPNGSLSADYRNGMGTGKNNSQLDDDTSQSVIRLLSRLDAAMGHTDPALEEAVTYALDRMLANGQYANGGFGQIWTDDPVEARPVIEARYYDGPYPDTYPGGDYWWHYTLNDAIPGTLAGALVAAHEVYGRPAYHDALVELGEFLLLAQMPAPQPAWAQQYDADMHPAWARKFEPPAVTGWESQDAMEALIAIAESTEDDAWLAPVPAALGYLEASLLTDGQLARFYELETNTPLYMTSDYELTYDDSDLPTHYGFKQPSRLPAIQAEYERVANGDPVHPPSWQELQVEAQVVIDALDEQGRWVEDGEIRSLTFNTNVDRLAAFIAAARI